jgi:hypothetical protein
MELVRYLGTQISEQTGTVRAIYCGDSNCSILVGERRGQSCVEKWMAKKKPGNLA